MVNPVWKWKKLLRGSMIRRLVLRVFMVVMALIVVSLLQMAREVRVIEPTMSNLDECVVGFGSNPDFKSSGYLSSALSFEFPPSVASREARGLSVTVFKGLMEKKLLLSNARALCVGEGSASAVLALRELGLFNALSVESHPFFSLLKRRFVYELEFENNGFDFVYSGNIDHVSVPALLVMEIERVLRPGGTGVMLVGARTFYSGSMMRLSIPVASFLKSSDVVHACRIGSFTALVFKKRFEAVRLLESFQLPASCPSVAKNKQFMKNLEPLADKQYTELSYLPKYMNISSRNRLVYINVGAGEFARTAVAKLSKSYCSKHHMAFDVFVIDHKTSVVTSYVTDPSITFVYDPALSGSATPEIHEEDYFSADVDEEEAFEFVPWFNETVGDRDFVVLMMNAKPVELNILAELFRTGAICCVDELFLRCADDCKMTTVCGECMNLLKSLRNSGVYVHQWLGD